jgi:hypothetical protein
MKRNIKCILPALFFLLLGTIINPSSLPAAEVTIVGEVNHTNQIVADDIVFEVDDTPEGHNLLTNFIGKRVKVTGNLIIDGDMRIIAVKSFEVVEK